MTVFRLKYVKAYVDRHGKRRHYYRRPGCVAVPLLGEPGSKVFMDAYHLAEEQAPKRVIGAEKEVPGSFGALIARYYKSEAYRVDLSEKTKATYRITLEKFRATRGDLLVKGLRQRHITAILDEKAGFPGAQQNLRKALRNALKVAVSLGWIDAHPMDGMRRTKKAVQGFRAWEREDIAAFKARWPTGTRERLALALLLYTAQRRQDVVRMGRQHIVGDLIRVKQLKTGTELMIPIHPDLKAELDAAPRDNLTFLMTQYGQPFSPAGFTNWFSEKAQEAGLPERSSPHGLRKAAAIMLAEAGCTPSQIMAVTGHKNLSEVTLYTAAADQVRLAREAFARTETGTKSSTPPHTGRQSRRKAQ